VIRPENFIYFFTVCGFFIGLIFSVINFMDPANILLYTAEITLFFYLFIHVVIMNFVDIKKFGTEIFNKKEYEEVSEYFISELDVREKKMDGLLLSIEKMNEKYEKIVKGTVSQDGANQKKAA
jgi:hypothetical protein